MQHAIVRENNSNTWSARCTCGWSTYLLFGVGPRDAQVVDHQAQHKRQGENSSVWDITMTPVGRLSVQQVGEHSVSFFTSKEEAKAAIEHEMNHVRGVP